MPLETMRRVIGIFAWGFEKPPRWRFHSEYIVNNRAFSLQSLLHLRGRFNRDGKLLERYSELMVHYQTHWSVGRVTMLTVLKGCSICLTILC